MSVNGQRGVSPDPGGRQGQYGQSWRRAASLDDLGVGTAVALGGGGGTARTSARPGDFNPSCGSRECGPVPIDEKGLKADSKRACTAELVRVYRKLIETTGPITLIMPSAWAELREVMRPGAETQVRTGSGGIETTDGHLSPFRALKIVARLDNTRPSALRKRFLRYREEYGDDFPIPDLNRKPGNEK